MVVQRTGIRTDRDCCPAGAVAWSEAPPEPTFTGQLCFPGVAALNEEAAMAHGDGVAPSAVTRRRSSSLCWTGARRIRYPSVLRTPGALCDLLISGSRTSPGPIVRCSHRGTSVPHRSHSRSSRLRDPPREVDEPNVPAGRSPREEHSVRRTWSRATTGQRPFCRGFPNHPESVPASRLADR